MISCPRCEQPLYPRLCKRTDEGWAHVACPIGWGARLARQRGIAERTEDLQWMAAHGENATGAARRLGISKVEALRAWCVRHDLGELWDTLRARDPRDHNLVVANQWRTAS